MLCLLLTITFTYINVVILHFNTGITKSFIHENNQYILFSIQNQTDTCICLIIFLKILFDVNNFK